MTTVGETSRWVCPNASCRRIFVHERDSNRISGHPENRHGEKFVTRPVSRCKTREKKNTTANQKNRRAFSKEWLNGIKLCEPAVAASVALAGVLRRILVVHGLCLIADAS